MKLRMVATGNTFSRYGYVDAAKGLAMIGVYCGHHGVIPSVLNDWFWAFHMPLFFIVTGLFSNKLRTLPVCDVIKSGLSKLILPYILTELILTVALLIMIHQTDVFLSPIEFLYYLYDNAIVKNHPIWFLLALFFGKCAIPPLSVKSLHSPSRDVLSLAIVVALFCIGWKAGDYLMNNGHADYGCVCKGLLSPIYIYVGMKTQYLFKHTIADSPYILFSSVIALLFAGYVSFNMYYFDYPLGIFNVLTSLVVCLALLYVLRFLCDRKNTIIVAIMPLLQFVGRNTLYILCAHTLELILKLHRFIPVYSEKVAHVIIFIMILLSVHIVKKVPVVGKIYQIRK